VERGGRGGGGGVKWRCEEGGVKRGGEGGAKRVL